MWTLSQIIGMGMLSVLSIVDIQFRKVPVEILAAANLAVLVYQIMFQREDLWLVLGGVEIPWDLGLLGHSDADVLTHAVMDALCGAAKLGDIGKLFPDSDPRYAGISSLELLRQVAALLKKGGWAVVNVDATLIAQAPKVGPCRREMEANLAAVLGVETDRVNVKATTEEHLGFTGDSSGMACHAVCLLMRL